ncbi:hypothetical protein BKA82DRAFT_4013020 [Pisolithus tinctorius]|nr:hypothetical protein BKA82DRAFT_4013020 [Pisolithus tinctorius]
MSRIYYCDKPFPFYWSEKSWSLPQKNVYAFALSASQATMRLTFSTDYYLNTSMADERGRTRYIVSTCGFLNRKTTVHKAGVSGRSSRPIILAIIKRGFFRSDKIWFRGREFRADQLMTTKRALSSLGVDFLWVQTIEHTSGRYTAQIAGSNEITCVADSAKYHKRNLGIRKPSHPPYLEISESLRHMLDHVVVTFIYAEMLSESE